MAGESDQRVYEYVSSLDNEGPGVTEYDSSSDDDDPGLRDEYLKMIWETQGFDIDGEEFKNLHGYGLIGALVVITEDTMEDLIRLSSHALKKHNEENGTELVFVRIIKANMQIGAWIRYYITFEAKDAKEDDPKEYQLLVSESFQGDEIEIEIFRRKPSSPTPPPSSA